jgi:transcriptional regulator with XRE-family HTH domain
MDDDLGLRLRQLRRTVPLTQEELASESGVSVDVIRKLEQGRRGSARTATLVALADALDVDLSELVGRRPRLDGGDDVRVLALRDALIAPELLAPTGDPVTAPPLEALRRGVASGWGDYWGGRLSRATAVAPDLVAQGRAAQQEHGADAAPLLAQSYQLVAALLVHLGKDDLAALAAERAVNAAAAGNDQLQWATVHGAYAQALLHQGRTDAAEAHAMWAAEQIEPPMSKATLPHLTVWGGLVLWAMAAAVAGGRKSGAVDYIGLARSAAGRFEHDRHDYQLNFGATQVAMQATHAYAMLGEPGKAMKAATEVQRDDLYDISYGRHLIDVAQAQLDTRDYPSMQTTLLEAQSMSAEWFRHQGPARSLVSDLVRESTRLSPTLRRLARTTGISN